MALGYSSLVTKFGTLNNRVKVKIVTAGFIGKIAFLIELAILKVVFTVISFPYFLLNGVRASRIGGRNNIVSVTAVPDQLQQVIVLSFIAIVLFAAGINALFSSFTRVPPTFHSSAAETLQFSGIRPYEGDAQFAIRSVTTTPQQPGLYFEGTGPSFSRAVIVVDGGQSEIGSTKVNGNGEWEFVKSPSVGRFIPGQHSAFAVFYGDDGSILGNPTPLKTFDVTTDFLMLVYRTLGLNTVVFGILLFGILGFSVVRLRKTTTA